MSAVTAGDLASALVASCRVLGVAPDQVFSSEGRKARTLAGAALRAAAGVQPKALARMLRLSPPELAPSLIRRAAITADMMLEVVEAIGGPAGAVALSQGLASPDAATARVDVEAPDLAPVVEAVAQGEPRVRAVAEPVAAPAGRATGRKGAGRPRRTAEDRKAYLRPRPVVAASVAEDRAVRLKPLTARVARWAGWFVAADWSVEETAELFDVHPDAVADALEFGVTA